MDEKQKAAGSVCFDRIAQPAEILALLRQFDPVFPHLKEKIQNYQAFSEKLAAHAIVCAMRLDGILCGLLVFYANDLAHKVAYISLLGLLPAWQGRNLGRLLIDYCAQVSLQSGMENLQLEVDLDNHNAIRFYEKMGFSRFGGAMAQSMYMKKSLHSG